MQRPATALFLLALPLAADVKGLAEPANEDQQGRNPIGLQRRTKEVRSEIAFAWRLASRMHYFDLAEKVLDGIDRQGLERERLSELDLVRCRIRAERALNERAYEPQGMLFAKAWNAFRNYREEHRLSQEAGTAYVELCAAYGSYLELSYDDGTSESSRRAGARIQAILPAAVQVSAELTAELRENPSLTTAQRQRLRRLLLVRGQMLHALGKVSGQTSLLEQAQKVMEELCHGKAPRSPFIELARIHASQGNYSWSIDLARFAAESAIPREGNLRLESGWYELSDREQEERWALVERAAMTLVEGYQARGEVGSARSWALYFFNTWKQEGFALSRSGYRSLLAVARTLAASEGHVGGSESLGNLAWFSTREDMERAGFSEVGDRQTATELAVSIARMVKEANPASPLESAAERVILEAQGR